MSYEVGNHQKNDTDSHKKEVHLKWPKKNCQIIQKIALELKNEY